MSISDNVIQMADRFNDNYVYIHEEDYYDDIDYMSKEYYEYQSNDIYDDGNVELDCELDYHDIICGERNDTGMGSRIIQEWIIRLRSLAVNWLRILSDTGFRNRERKVPMACLIT